MGNFDGATNQKLTERYNITNERRHYSIYNAQCLTLGLPRGGWLPPTRFVFLHYAIDSYGI